MCFRRDFRWLGQLKKLTHHQYQRRAIRFECGVPEAPGFGAGGRFPYAALLPPSCERQLTGFGAETFMRVPHTEQ